MIAKATTPRPYPLEERAEFDDAYGAAEMLAASFGETAFVFRVFGHDGKRGYTFHSAGTRATLDALGIDDMQIVGTVEPPEGVVAA